MTLAVVLTSFSLMAAESVRLVSKWRNPTGGSINRAGQKVATFVLTLEESMRFGPEESLASELRERGVNALAGYTLLPGELVKDTETAKTFLTKENVTGVVLMRVLGEEERKKMHQLGVVWYSGSYYPGFWDYWQTSWTAVYVPSSVGSDKVFTIETALFSLVENKPIWVGTCELTNPENLRESIHEIVKIVSEELRDAGLIAK
jgi:hypothetical protein